MRDPFWLAKQATSIEQLSGGRFILGVGVGAYREEFTAWAPRLAGKAMRGAMVDEGLSLLRRLSQQVSANLVGSPDLITDKIASLGALGVDHACALMIPADSVRELEEQIEWFAEIALRP
jgi:alkanesulfonate monooxygenase SsuD/methylene tetrahydromethanopterin reductase-like flavin-dependent oxidoreductase (luciferase family)